MTPWGKLEWQARVDEGSGIRVYWLAGVLADSRDSFTLIEQVRAEMRSDPRPVLRDMAGIEKITSATPSPGRACSRPQSLHGRRASLWVLLTGAWVLIAATPCLADWPSDPASNLPICTSPVSQNVPQIVSDGSGGAIIVWQTTSTAGLGRIFAQRVDRMGQAAWGKQGRGLCAVAGDQQAPMVVPDSSGGAIVVWQDHRSGRDWDVYAQRIDRFGDLRWHDEAVSISGAPGNQLAPRITADGRGGALIAWQDLRKDSESDLYAQALDSAGHVRWSPDGIAIFAGPGAQLAPEVVASGSGGVFVWRDSRGGEGESSIHAQRVNAEGNPMWATTGALVDEGATPEAHPVAIDDGRGSVIIAWESGPIYAQRLDATGQAVWGAGGVALSTADGMAPAIVPDGDGGAVIAWQTASFDDEASDVRAQSVRASGTLRWGADGIPVCLASGAQAEVVATESLAGGAIVMWRDARNDEFADIYAQRVDSSGTALWRAEGVVVSDAPGFQNALVATTDGFGGAVATWVDGRAGRHIFAQRVSARGRLGGIANANELAPGGRLRLHSIGGGTGPRRK